MGNSAEIVKKLDQAWKNKDESAMRLLLHPDYHFKGPMMEMKSVDEAIVFMKDCPFECDTQTSMLISEGNKAVHVFDWHVTAPFQATIPMVEVLEIEDNKIKKARLFFDTALFPEEAKTMMSAECPTN